MRPKTLTIGTLAKMSKIGVETIRFYEREGLISPASRRAVSGYREYDSASVKRMQFIRKCKDLGFSLAEIKEILSLRVRSASKCATVKLKTEVKIKDIQQRILQLQEIKRSLEELSRRCHEEMTTSECPILDYLDEEASK